MENQTLIIIGIIALGGGLALGYQLWSPTKSMHGAHLGMPEATTPTPMHRGPDGTPMHHGAESHAGHNMDDHMTVESERAFLEGMIPHHQEAVTTAKEVLTRGGSTPQIRQLAEAIVAAQEAEIAQMKSWYQDWYGVPYTASPEAYQPMMRDLSSLSGAALDAAFLEDMIPHHMGAIMMARSVTPHIEHQAVADLAEAIIRTQADEIELMRGLLSELQN